MSPKVLEYNCRFGDPETQAVLTLLKSDLYEIFTACAKGTLKDQKVEWSDESAVTVVMAAAGYPGSYPKGMHITFDNIPEGVKVFHAGTKLEEGDKIATSGGRILAVTANAGNLKAAQDLAYQGVKCCTFENSFYRTDIASKALAA